MAIAVILTVCLLVLLSYLFDVTAAYTKIPSIILLLLLGWLARQASGSFNVIIPDLSDALPILGTIGLILIVLEGSLELELNKSKFSLIKKSFSVAFIPMLAFGFLFAAVIHFAFDVDFRIALANVVPLSVISSSIAIPSSKNMSSYNKEFITYESSLSDILGVIFFNFVALNSNFDILSFGGFFVDIIIIIIISFLATLLLSYLLSRIEHDIKFVPIVLLVIVIYEVSKIFNLPSLVFILVFGLFLGNLDEIKNTKIMEKLRPVSLNKEVHKFLEFVREITFLIKSLFFLLFGFLINTQELLDPKSIFWSIGITAAIILIRALMLKLSGLPIKPLVFVAPRGLINILLFLSLPVALSIPLISSSMVSQVMILTSLVMMFGLMATGKKENTVKKEEIAIKKAVSVAENLEPPQQEEPLL